MSEGLEVLLHLTRTFATDNSCKHIHLVMASRKGGVKMLEVSTDHDYRLRLYEALTTRILALGLLGFEESDGMLQAKRFLFPWHEKDPSLSGLFERLCDEAVEQVQKEFEKGQRVH